MNTTAKTQSLHVEQLQTDYRFFIKNTLMEKIKKNQQYSMRSFARDLGLSPSFLSLVLNYKRNLSYEIGLNICEKLQWSGVNSRYFLTLIEYETETKPQEKQKLAEKIAKISPARLEQKVIQCETFALISKWYYFAIIELTKTKKPPKNFKEISKRLSITESQAKEAVEMLFLLGFIKKEHEHFATDYNAIVLNQGNVQLIRDLHRSYLLLATNSIDQQDPQTRDISGRTLAISQKQLPKVKELITEFRSAIARLSDSEESKDTIYHLGVQFFRLDR